MARQSPASIDSAAQLAPNIPNGPPVHIRLEVIEIALRTLSDNMQKLESMMGNDVTLDDGAISSQLTELASSVADLTMNTTSACVMAIRGTVSATGTITFPNITGTLVQDVEQKPCKMSAGRKVRLMYPQQSLPDGRVFMGGMWVDTQSMEISSGWVQVCNVNTEDRFMQDFTV